MSQSKIRRIVERTGVTVVQMTNGGADHYDMRVRAPSGAERNIKFDRLPDAAANNKRDLSDLRRFVRENPAPVKTVIQQAVAKAGVLAHTPIATALQRAIEIPQAPSPSAPPESLAMTDSTPATPARKPQATANKLDTLQTIQLADWLRAYDFEGKKPTVYQSVLDDAKKAFAFAITLHNINGMMVQLGLKLYVPPKPAKPKKVTPPTDNERMLAGHLRALMQHVNFKVPAELAELAGPEDDDTIF